MNLSDLKPEEWRVRLAHRLDAELANRTSPRQKPGLRELNAYYDGAQPLSYMHPELMAELGDRIRQVVINWPRLVVDSVEERLDVEGFRYADDESAAEDLWAIWQANGMDEQSQQAHVDSLVMGRSFIVVGTNPDDAATPLVTVESPLQMYAEIDPATRRIRAVIKRINERDPITGSLMDQYETVYLPNETVRFRTSTGPGARGWQEESRDEHKLGRPPVEMLANRPRMTCPGGVSELLDVIPLSDAACKVATDMMVAAEAHAIARRAIFGVSEEDFIDEQGNKISALSALAGHVWAFSDPNVKAMQFPESDLRNFHQTLDQLARIASALSATPPSYFGLQADDAASADAIRSRETRKVKRAERIIRTFSGVYEGMNRLILRFRDGDWDPRAQRLETLWRDPSTPTIAQRADATVKLVSAKIVPIEQAREDLGYTAVQRERMRGMDEDALNAYRYNDPAGLEGPKAPPLADVTGAVDG